MEVRADTSARVWEVRVTAGEAVDEGDELLLLDGPTVPAPVRAPRSGRIVAVHVSPGDLVDEADPLLDLS